VNKGPINLADSVVPDGQSPLLIEWWPVEKPVDYPKNARKWSERALEKVALSLTEFGFRQPIVVDAAGVIVIGHLRRAAARLAGLDRVPVHIAADLSPEKVRELRLMDNRSHDEAAWDLELLEQEMRELAALDIDLSLTGFDKFQWPGDGVQADWTGMPEFEQEDQLAWKTVMVHFLTPEDRQQFAQLVGQPLTDKTKYIWHPKQERVNHLRMRYVTAEEQNPRYPVYVISKGRWESRLTSKALEAIKVPYRIVVEPQERDAYAAVIDPGKILVLPFSNLGQGSIPARNWVWEHALSEGHKRHWILDDNIRKFYRLFKNVKVPMGCGVTFRASEDFVDRYENVGLAGMQYQYLAKQKQKLGPFVLNTRIYSCILIDNALEHRWRGRYNEDTDLSLRVLKDGLCTVLFQAFLADKITTMVMKGGNTEELYQGDGRLQMARSLEAQHPDVVTVTRKWGRYQHQVDYRPFRGNKFIPKPGFEAPQENDEYGMEIEYLDESGALINGTT
jgi:hypothetical protein